MQCFARFQSFSLILPAFLLARPELCTTSYLQKLCDCVREHQDWGLAHVAVSLDMVDLLSGEKFKSDVDRADGDGVTPLMLAVSLGSKHLTLGVLVAGCRYVI